VAVQQKQKDAAKSDVQQTSNPKPDTNIHPIQNGYKEFHWGESIKTVRSKAAPTHQGEFNGIMAILYTYYFQNGRFSLNEAIPSKELYSSRYQLDAYLTEDSDMEFAFQNRRLFSVTVYFTNQPSSITSDLEQKFGSVASQFLQRGAITSEIKAWFSDPDRIVLYENNGNPSWESVTYIDKSFYDAFVNNLRSIRLHKQ
jgi:hypothetical protein